MSLSSTKKNIHVASDHAGYEHKKEIVTWLRAEGQTVIDHGALIYDAEDDFPDYISKAAAAVSAAPEDSVGIIFGGSGQGEAMMANRFPNVRATVFYGGDPDIVKLSREHNDANVLSVGARFVEIESLKESIAVWLATPVLLDEKYRRRNQKIEKITRAVRII